jgi:uncharacterized membrane protein YphA (DoxX/SURF4 family)
MLLRRIARPMLAAAFIGQGIDALRSPKPAAEAAQPTVEGLHKLPESVSSSLPDNAETIAKITAGVQIGGGLLLASGRVPRLASAALAATVIPANLGAHMFWNEVDPQRKAAKRREFLTDVSLIGGLAIAAADTAGKPSLGWRGRQAAHKLTDSVTAALPLGTTDSDLADRIGERLHEGAERGREFAVLAADKAAEKGAPLLEAARERGAELADRSAPLLEAARERGTELAAELAKTAREQSEEVASEARERVRAWRRH